MRFLSQHLQAARHQGHPQKAQAVGPWFEPRSGNQSLQGRGRKFGALVLLAQRCAELLSTVRAPSCPCTIEIGLWLAKAGATDARHG